MNESAIIVAGGSGIRMNSDTPKQFILINNLPVIMHTLLAFHSYREDLNIILVLPSSDLKTWKDLCEQHNFSIPVKIVSGGKTRFKSVQKGIALLEDEGLVAIHDGVRPLINKEVIAASFKIASLYGSAIAAVKLIESIRELDKDHTKSVDRSRYRIIQTPQTFQVPIIKKAYLQPESKSFTDDASVVEKAGFKISLFEGSYRNIKITTPQDIVIAESLLKKH